MKYLSILVFAFALSACGEATTETASDEFSVTDAGVKTKSVAGFGGVIAESYDDAQEWWADEERPRDGAPNIIITHGTTESA